jgi:hypothetical protein
MPASQSVVQDLVERDAIQRLMIRYLNANDAHDWDSVVSCFAENGSFGTVVGRAALREMFGQVRKDRSARLMPVDEVKQATHVLSNVEIELNGDTAKGFSVARSYLLGRRQSEMILLVRGFTYDDELIKEHGEWRISKRIHTLKWMFETRPIQSTPELQYLDTI